MNQAASQSQKTTPLYFINAWADYLLIGGFSIIAYFLLKAVSVTGFQAGAYTIVGAAYLSWVINNPHFSATNYRLYSSKQNMMQFPITAFVVPFLVVGGMVASMAYPDTVAPYFVKFFILWSPYHFSGQSLGITMIYARRAGFKIGPWERKAFSTFIFFAFISTLLVYELKAQGPGMDHYGIPYPSFGVPAWSVTVASTIMYLAGAGVIFFAARWSIMNKKMLPPIVLLPAATHFVWYLGGTDLAAFDELVPMFHSLQYMVIAWSVQMKEKLDDYEEKKVTPTSGFTLGQSAKWLGANIIGGVILFEGLPYLLPGASTNFVLATGIIAAGVQIHHFFVDGVIWKLRKQTNLHPLMSNIPSLLRQKVVRPGLTQGRGSATGEGMSA